MRQKLLTAGLLAVAVFGGWRLGHWAAYALSPGWSATGRDSSLGAVADVRHTERDFGTVPQGTLLQATFPITNLGSRRLILRGQSQACCGESGKGQVVVVAAGDSHDLLVEVDTARWHGAMKHTAIFESNDPQRPYLRFTVRAEVDGRPLRIFQDDLQGASRRPTPRVN